MHRVNRTLLPSLVGVCLILAAGSLGATWLSPGSQAGSSTAAPPALDFEFFKSKVQPIFLAKRPGHARCVACHGGSSRGIHLEPLSPGSKTWNEAESRKNFESAKKVVVPGSLKSPLLIHPMAEAAGGDFFHSGGKHFNSQNDPEWQALKAWVMGAKAE